jgi:hypothetical protein
MKYLETQFRKEVKMTRFSERKYLMDKFDYKSYPGDLQFLLKQFHDLAHTIDQQLYDCPPFSSCLSLLYESMRMAIEAKRATDEIASGEHDE